MEIPENVYQCILGEVARDMNADPAYKGIVHDHLAEGHVQFVNIDTHALVQIFNRESYFVEIQLSRRDAKFAGSR